MTARMMQELDQMAIALPVVVEHGVPVEPRSPVDALGTLVLTQDTRDSARQKVTHAVEAFQLLRSVPAPTRGEVVRRFGDQLRAHQVELARLVTWETGKIIQEALGEVQEMIDICDFAVGLSRQVGGRTMPSERRDHRIMEQWHPLGPVGVISAFNFPVAVWAWNTAIAVVCGNPVVWKPSLQAPLCAWAAHSLLLRASTEVEGIPEGISQWVLGGVEHGEALAEDTRLPLISATGSTEMGRAVGTRVAARLGRSLLELGGNNAMIVAPSARLDLALRAIVFAAVGTAGQRCTTLRRLIVHRSRIQELILALTRAFSTLRVGDPFDPRVHVGPLVSDAAATHLEQTIAQGKTEGGSVVCGGGRLARAGAYVEPVIMSMPSQTAIMHHECFAPLLYVVPYDEWEEAIQMQNAVPQGLSSALLTESMTEAELFLSAGGSDCGIANVNIGTSGAEIGGAFGGEKDTGGGREAGSDAWKNYMRRATNTINYGGALPLAQGIRFALEPE